MPFGSLRSTVFSMDRKPRAVKRRKRDEELTQAPKRLRWRRFAAGMSLRDLAGKSGLGIATISDLENGYYSAEPATLAALARGLDCEITDLMPPEPVARRRGAA